MPQAAISSTLKMVKTEYRISETNVEALVSYLETIHQDTTKESWATEADSKEYEGNAGCSEENAEKGQDESLGLENYDCVPQKNNYIPQFQVNNEISELQEWVREVEAEAQAEPEAE